ncbi:MAG TPA: ATP-binding protein [Terracidiphilus sp.]|nr:ATP-binding protein [Terracidiphilus sp.]
MLLKFRCKNFRSIREEQELSFIAENTRSDEKSDTLIETPFEDLRLLRCLAIFGQNASGKSNVLDAMASFRRIVSDSWRRWKAGGPIPEFDPFLLDETSTNGNTEMEVTFLVRSRIYKYGFLFDRNSVIEEHLIDSTRRDKVLFRRTKEGDGAKVEFPNNNLGKTKEERLQLERIRVDTRPNSLFLSAAAQFNFQELSAVYTYLDTNFKSIHSKNMPPRQSYTAEMCSDERVREQIVGMLRFADAGITNIEVAKHELSEQEKKRMLAMIKSLREVEPESFSSAPSEPSQLPSVIGIRMAHNGESGKTYFLDESKESDGTQAYFSILGPLLDSFRDGEVLLIDELESSLHPKLVTELVRTFNSPKLNPKGAQILFTTHDTSLLDLDLVRRDQIWFTDKTRDGTTRLYPLTDYQPRTNQNIQVGYMGGRFGAIPFLDDQLLRETLVGEEPAQTSLKFSGEE